MSKCKSLPGKTQLLIDDLVAGDLSDQRLMAKHHIRPSYFRELEASPAVIADLEARIDCNHRRCAAMLAAYAPKAAARLIELSLSTKEEIARKACLDILELAKRGCVPARGSAGAPPEGQTTLSEKSASAILGILADNAESYAQERCAPEGDAHST